LSMPLPQKSSGGGGTSGAWSELGRALLAAPAATLTLNPIAAMNQLWYFIYVPSTSLGGRVTLTFNNDAANNYAFRYLSDGVAGSVINQPNAGSIDQGASTGTRFVTGWVWNPGAREKMYSEICVDTPTGVASAPHQQFINGHWVNVVNQIVRFDIASSAGTLAAGSIIIVWGSA